MIISIDYPIELAMNKDSFKRLNPFLKDILRTLANTTYDIVLIEDMTFPYMKALLSFFGISEIVPSSLTVTADITLINISMNPSDSIEPEVIAKNKLRLTLPGIDAKVGWKFYKNNKTPLKFSSHNGVDLNVMNIIISVDVEFYKENEIVKLKASNVNTYIDALYLNAYTIKVNINEPKNFNANLLNKFAGYASIIFGNFNNENVNKLVGCILKEKVIDVAVIDVLEEFNLNMLHSLDTGHNFISFGLADVPVFIRNYGEELYYFSIKMRLDKRMVKVNQKDTKSQDNLVTEPVYDQTSEPDTSVSYLWDTIYHKQYVQLKEIKDQLISQEREFYVDLASPNQLKKILLKV